LHTAILGKAVFFYLFLGFKSMDDSIALLKAIRNMDAVAITKVFDLYAPAIYKYAYYHCGNAMTADQIVGNVFEKLMEQLSEGRGPSSNLRFYLVSIRKLC
jgi:DNA-directed RNA polymerase specialized sigma24 family protein